MTGRFITEVDSIIPTDQNYSSNMAMAKEHTNQELVDEIIEHALESVRLQESLLIRNYNQGNVSNTTLTNARLANLALLRSGI